MLVLDGNNPRFPWAPSITMLNYRLKGTTELSASNRGGRHSLAVRADRCSGQQRPNASPDLRPPWRGPKVLYVAELDIHSLMLAAPTGFEPVPPP
jgi:hypothetical protein